MASSDDDPNTHGPLAKREHQNRLAPVDQTPAERIAELREAVGDARHKVDDSLKRIRRDVDHLTDVDGWIRDNPWRSVGIAFGIGFYLGFR